MSRVCTFWRLAGQNKPSLVGFWIVHGHDYLLTGPVGPPDREPPMAREVLSALTEAVWWKQFTVWPRKGGTWRPLVVQEWIPEVANRSMFHLLDVHLPKMKWRTRRMTTGKTEVVAGWSP